MPDKYITLQIPSEFFTGYTEKSAKFKIWHKRPFNAPFSMMKGFGEADDNTNLLELTTNEHGECYEFTLKEWLIDQEDNRSKLEKFFVEPPEPKLPLFDNPFIAGRKLGKTLADDEGRIINHEIALDGLARQNVQSNEEDKAWERLEAIGESLEQGIFVESEYEQ